MYYADRLGLDNVLAKLTQLQAATGDAFKAAPLLENLEAEGRRFGNLNKGS
jgi:3-hydroxyacyl-CoA dehydrogenase